MHHKPNARSQGFTLIELMLAMAFFSSILIMSTVVLVQIFGIYNKGLAVKQINSVGRALTDDIIRVGNSASGEVTVTGSDPTHPRCLVLGRTVYLWSYDGDSASSNSVYKTNSASSPDLITFARYVNTNQSQALCPSLGYIDPAYVQPILSDNIRVYKADVEEIGGAKDLLRLSFVFGTYAGVGSSNNPSVDGSGAVSCSAGSLGNFCAFGTYSTVIYLPN